jgi:crotonobetainyl-CoA:carnitine CoA-transferase CaiB-like acyl-CoA transferase
MLSGSTLGQTGPERAATGWGPNSMAVAGVPHLTGYAGGAPSSLDATFPDFAIGVQMAFSLLVALHERRSSGKGQHIDLAMAEAVSAMIPEAVFDFTVNGRESERRGNRSAFAAPQGVYPCRDEDSWVAISVEDDAQWRALRRALAEPAWAADAHLDTTAGRLADHDRVDRELAAWTRERSNTDAMRVLQAAGVAAAAVLNAPAVACDPQIEALGYMVEVDHAEVGVRRVPGLPNRYSAMPALAYRPAPLLGEHNEDVLCGLLGLTRADYDALVEDRVVF